MRDAKDGEILALALKHGRVVVTLDRDFPQILALTEASFPSVVLIRQERLRALAVVELLENVFERHGQQLRDGCVLSIGASGIRLRALPLK
jgi:predicted nuclease of predicted toxin-antitoxin system